MATQLSTAMNTAVAAVAHHAGSVVATTPMATRGRCDRRDADAGARLADEAIGQHVVCHGRVDVEAGHPAVRERRFEDVEET